MLPEEVLKEAADAVVDYQGDGLSILEIPHRGEKFDSILEESKALVNELCELKGDHEVLWLQGGGRMQFAMIPMNFLGDSQRAGYLDSGHWSHSAIESAGLFGTTEVLSSSKQNNYSTLPDLPASFPKDLAYVHITTNNTIYGTQWNHLPLSGPPLIADMSSDILSRKREYDKCALFYAAVQKNVGPAGATLTVVRNDMLKQIKRKLPAVLDYREQVKSNSVLNTPPVFAIYASLLMLRWTKKSTIAALERESIAKSQMLYDEVERNKFFAPVVRVKEHRSRMNVCFTAATKEAEKRFTDLCHARNIVGVEGHRSVGGFRASLYNAMPIGAVTQLVSVMQEFEQTAN